MVARGCSIKKIRLSVAAVILGLMVLAPMVMAAANQNPGVLPINSKPYGLSYGEWSIKWWQWAVSIPAATNPLIDTTGEFCGEGQSGNVWFLAGTTGGSATRTCTIPAGKAIFLPIVNQFDCCEEGQTVDDMRKNVTYQIDNVTSMDFKLDGVPLQNLFSYRAPSPGTFELTLPDNNIFGVPAGVYGPTVSDGYYLMLAPLSRGQHTIDFAGSISPNAPFGSFDLNVHYNINIVPREP
jgi:hypothetical protein